MLSTPFYDPKKSYEENFEQGPFGAFADGEDLRISEEAKYDFFGIKVSSPFGIPAGPLINSNFCKGAFLKGFDICVYKTIRSGEFPCHPFPNILRVVVMGDITPEVTKHKLLADDKYEEPLSITNSFGVPSRMKEVWQEDVRRAMSYANEGQVLVLGFMGTVKEGQTEDEFIEDYVNAGKLAKETGVKVLEVNLSCPNIGNEGLVCYNLDMTEKVCKRLREALGDTPLILKVGYYSDFNQIKKLAEIADRYADGVSAINTISAEVVNDSGEQALPGPNRLRSGVCGHGIKWAGIEMVENLKKARAEIGGKFKIIGVGGVMNKEDFENYINKGADYVMSATGAMWNPYLAQEIKETLK
ncbi:MAG: dihydroorotate dehydrogenase catalytic subunit [Patescibacteria group bacterium]|nr:dihydroorotate dehydrogenase catalytic subunit [Patescibacteria group bacterium]